MTLRRGHLLLGFLTIAAFIGTGIYLKLNAGALLEGEQVMRYQYRANHVNIVMAGLVNLGVGAYLPRTLRRRRVAHAGSVLLVLAPFVFLAAFIIEPPRMSPHRILTSIGVLLLFAGVVCHLAACGKRPAPIRDDARAEQ